MALTDLEIAQQAKLLPIKEIAERAGIPFSECEQYGNYMAKVNFATLPEVEKQNKLHKRGKLILVTAITPTPAGEGKTTTTIGLADALNQRGKNAIVALREPSLGPVFGIKGGAAGGGYAQVVPMEQLNLHFTGDFHALTSANNLLAAMLDNHIHQGNELDIDTRNITWRRCVDMNDRQLRNVLDGLGGKTNGVPREDGFDITVASEVMAVLCLSSSYTDLKKRLGRMIVAYSRSGKPITCDHLKATGAMAVLLKEALKPNLVQTLEHTPALVHGGPFANIAHGCNSVLATKTALAYSNYTITEAGFGADLGAEKFLDIKCRLADLSPDAVVLVATIRALKMHGGVVKKDLNVENIEAMRKGMPNLLRHAANIKEVFNLPVVVAINRFPSDTDAEVAELLRLGEKEGLAIELSDVWAKGGAGALTLADKVVEVANQDSELTFCYADELDLCAKIESIAKRIYRADKVNFTKACQQKLAKLTELGYGNLPICMAKTQYSFSDDATKLGAPETFEMTVRDVRLAAGAGFVVALTGTIMTMPGLPKVPAAEQMDLLPDGTIVGLS